MPAKAGIQRDATARAGMDSGFRQNDSRLSEGGVIASAATEALSVTLPWLWARGLSLFQCLFVYGLPSS
jgi:hypothetical protein